MIIKTQTILREHLMKKISLVALVAVVGIFFTNGLYAQEEHKHGQSAKAGPQTIQGEVLDMACYMAHEGKGAKHKKCAETCIKGGAPIGLLTPESQVYLLVEDHNAPKPYSQIKAWAAEQVSVSGEIHQRGGVQAIIVKAAAKVK